MGNLIRDEAFVYIPSSQNLFTRPECRNDRTIIKSMKQMTSIRSNELTLKSNTISETNESYKKPLEKPKIMLRKSDKKIYQSFKEMLLSYDQEDALQILEGLVQDVKDNSSNDD